MTRTACFALLFSVVACASPNSQSAIPTRPAPRTLSAADSIATARARADSAQYPYTAADIHFVSGMIAHHSQAITMAGWAPSHDASPSLRILAERILNEQQDETATMQQWLRDRQQPLPEVGPNGITMVMNGMQHQMLMPGMLTAAQMRQLDGAMSAQFDSLFLTFMIQHHGGAISMVNDLLSTSGAMQDQTVFKLATDINADQSTEIARMQQMLAAMHHSSPSR